MVSKVARNRFGSRGKRHFCCNEVGSWSMAPTKVLSCSYGQALSFEHSQYEQLAEGRALREFTPSESLKKSSFFCKKLRSLSHENTVCGNLLNRQCIICQGQFELLFERPAHTGLPPLRGHYSALTCDAIFYRRIEKLYTFDRWHAG